MTVLCVLPFALSCVTTEPMARSRVLSAVRTSSSSLSRFSGYPPNLHTSARPIPSTSLPVSGNWAMGTDDGSVFSCILTVTVGLDDCRDVRCSFSFFTLLSRLFFGARVFGHNDWKWPVCLQLLHNFPAAGQGNLVCAVRPQFGHFDGRAGVWVACLIVWMLAEKSARAWIAGTRFPSSVDGTGVRAGRYVLASVDGGFFRATNRHCISKSEVVDGEALRLVSSLQMPTTRRSRMISSCCCESLALHSRHACVLQASHSFVLVKLHAWWSSFREVKHESKSSPPCCW